MSISTSVTLLELVQQHQQLLVVPIVALSLYVAEKVQLQQNRAVHKFIGYAIELSFSACNMESTLQSWH